MNSELHCVREVILSGDGMITLIPSRIPNTETIVYGFPGSPNTTVNDSQVLIETYRTTRRDLGIQGAVMKYMGLQLVTESDQAIYSVPPHIHLLGSYVQTPIGEHVEHKSPLSITKDHVRLQHVNNFNMATWRLVDVWTLISPDRDRILQLPIEPVTNYLTRVLSEYIKGHVEYVMKSVR